MTELERSRAVMAELVDTSAIEVRHVNDPPKLVAPQNASFILMVNNKVLDGVRIDDPDRGVGFYQVQLKLISTLKMIADCGTKALDRRQFEFCRDVLNGYALAKSAGNTTRQWCRALRSG